MSVVTRHTACVVLLDALGGVAIGNFLRSLGSLCPPLACVPCILVYRNLGCFPMAMRASSFELPGLTHTPFECSNSPLVCAIMSNW